MEKNKLKRGHDIELNISDLAFGGRGIAKVDDLIFFVKDAIPNQKIIAKITKNKKNYIEAYKVDVLDNSKDEIKPECDHFQYCGGCTTQQLNYKKQLYYKEKQVFGLFKKISGIQNPTINSIIGCDKIYFYRNKMEFTFSGNPWYIGDESYEDIIIGLHVPKRFDKILSINFCHINYEIFNEIINVVKQISNKEELKPYNVIKHTGFLRYLVLRAGVNTGEIMVNIVTSGYKPKLLQPIINELTKSFTKINSIVNTINADKNNTAKGSTKLLFGKECIHEKIDNYSFKISPNSFFQTNSYQVKNLYDYIIKAGEFKQTDVVYDLYCGTGSIGIYISKLVKKVYGVEIIKEAIKDAQYNAKLNKIYNIEFYSDDLKDFFSRPSTEIYKPDIVILDPPRPGLHPNVIDQINTLNPRKIIYVSCNPATQARDIKKFADYSYTIKDIQPLDMFPHTPHIECIVTLINKD